MASIKDFVQSPSDDFLKSYRKDQLLKVADNYSVELPKKLNKSELLVTLKAQLVEEKILAALVGCANTPVEMDSFSDVASLRVSGSVKLSNIALVLTGLGIGLTFEQQKQLTLLQLQQEQKNALEFEVELDSVQARQQLELERHKLELMSERKLPAKPQKVGELVLLVPPPLLMLLSIYG